MVLDETAMQLACAILPGLMSRYGESGYSDTGAIHEAFRLANERINEICKATEAVEAGPSTSEPTVEQIADEMHAFVVKHANGEPIYAVAHIERWSRELRAAQRKE